MAGLRYKEVLYSHLEDLAHAVRDFGRDKRDVAREHSLEAVLDASSARLEAWLAVAREDGLPIPEPRYRAPTRAAGQGSKADFCFSVGAAREKRILVVRAPVAHQLCRMASSHGLGRQDFSSVYKFLKPSSNEAALA